MNRRVVSNVPHQNEATVPVITPRSSLLRQYAGFVHQSSLPLGWSPRAHLHMVEDVAVYVFDIHQPSLPTRFYSVLVFIVLCPSDRTG